MVLRHEVLSLRSGAPISSVPIHEFIQSTLRRRIERGELTEGVQLPSESALQKEFQASRTPVRQALRRLQSDGLIVRAQGRGSYVASAKIGVALRPMVSFSGELRRQGHSVIARTLLVRAVPAPPEVAQALGVALGESTTHIRRLEIVDGTPLAYFEHWLAPSIPHASFEAAGDFASLYALLRDHGCEPWYGTETIAAEIADDQIGAVLEYPPRAPLLKLRRVSRDMERRPIEHTVYWVRADRYEYEINLIRQRR